MSRPNGDRARADRKRKAHQRPGRRSLTVTPSGRVLPCHAVESTPGLTFWNVRDHALGDIWANSPAFKAFRGTDFLPAFDAGCVAELAAVPQDTPYAYRRM